MINFDAELKQIMMNLQEAKIKEVECPCCLGIQQVFDGLESKECNFCKGKGVVNEDKNNYFIRGIEEEFFDS